jgi:hypothetical protein
MKTALSALLVLGCAVLASAQATAPTTAPPRAVTQVRATTVVRHADGAVRFRGGVKYETVAAVDIEAEDIDVTSDGGVLVIRGGATVTLRAVAP